MIPDVIPNAIVFKVDYSIRDGAYNDVIADIKRLTKNWVGLPTHEAVFSHHPYNSTRQYVPLSFQLPDDPDGIDEIVSDVAELNRVYPTRNLNWVAENKKKPGQKTRVKKPEPKPAVDPNNIVHGHDITKVKAELRFMLTEDGPEIDAENFAAALDGYPFADKSPAQNRDYIEIELIASFEMRYPFLADLNRLFGGKIIRELRVLADVRNQQRLPAHWHQAFGRAFVRGGNNPATYEQCCNFISGYFVMLERIAAKGKVTPQPSKIASRFTELAIETDHITAAAIAFG
ncbi:hypothetical protein ACS4RR_020845 [Rhizobium sp. Z1P35]